MGSQSQALVRQVKPILSVSREDARRKVLTLYKAWIRQVPSMLLSYDIPKTEAACKAKIREEFKRHAHVTDLRIIDRLIIRIIDVITRLNVPFDDGKVRSNGVVSTRARSYALVSLIDSQVRGQMELQEVANIWKTKGGLMYYWKETWEKKPTDFMSKFLSGHD